MLETYYFSIPLWLSIVFIVVPLSFSLIINSTKYYRNKKRENEVNLIWESNRYYLLFFLFLFLCAVISLLMGTDALIFYRNQDLSDTPIELYVPMVVLIIGGNFLLILLGIENLANLGNGSILESLFYGKRKNKSRNEKILPFKTSKRTHLPISFIYNRFQCIFIIGIVLGACGSIGGIFLFGEPWLNWHTDSFSSPAYSLPEPGATHYNQLLDNSSLVNQTILGGLEKAMWAFTKLQRMGGFPLGSAPDGTKMWSDRPEIYSLYPGEFSLQQGTGLDGEVYINMYKLEPNPDYLNVAKAVGDALLAVQDNIYGGRGYEGRRYADGQGYLPEPHNYRCSAVLDDYVMQSCMIFLLDLYNVTREPKYLEGIEKGFACINSMEVKGGGWEQRSNFPEDCYPSYVTLTDFAMRDVVFLMLKAYDLFNNTKYLNAAERAGNFLIRVQGSGGSEIQKGWAQQYNKNDMPAWARHFEPPAICSMQTAGSIQILMALFLCTGNMKWIAPIPAAVQWLNDSKITYKDQNGNLQEGWARLYELGTNDPIYGLANGGPWAYPQYTKNFEQARGGYVWQSDFGISAVLSDYQKLVEVNYNISAYNQLKNNEMEQGLINNIRSDAQQSYLSLNNNGFWVTSDGILSVNFAQNAKILINYAQLAISGKLSAN